MTIQDLLVKEGRWEKTQKGHGKRYVSFDNGDYVDLYSVDVEEQILSHIEIVFTPKVKEVLPIAEPGDTFEFIYRINVHE